MLRKILIQFYSELQFLSFLSDLPYMFDLVIRKDLNLKNEKIGIALPLIIDSEIVEENLKPNNLSIEWINNLLKKKGLPLEEVLYMELGIDGQIKIERKDLEQ